MKTPYPHILSCIAVSILTACGGGGGGGTPSVAPTPTYPIVQPGNIPNPSGHTERTATSPAGNQADANNALEASEENIHKEVENSVNSTQTSSENQNQDVKADSNDKAEAERKAAEEAAKAKAEAERKAAEEAAKAKAEAGRKATEEAAKAKAEAERKAAEEAEKAAKAKAEAERKAAEEAAKAKAEAERKAAEEAAKAKTKAEAERKAAEEAAKAKAEAERKAAEEAAKAKAEADRKAAEKAAKAKAEAERKAAEEVAKAKAEAERKAAEEAAKAKAEAERKAAEEAAKVKAEEERKTAEEAAKAKAEAERKAAEEAAKAEAEHKAAEEVTPKAEVAMQSIGGFYTMLSVDGADNKVINRVGNPDVLEVNGQKINLLPQTFDAANGMLSLSDNKIIRAIGTHLQYGHYGFYGSKKENGELNSSLVFYQGLMTPLEAMPQTGSAIYQGNAFYNDVSNINTVGSSLFNVDFGEKSLTGGVYSAEGRFNPVMLQANIAGNRFVYVDGTTKNSMSGIFLGPQAEEMAGRFDHPSEGKSGTFGAAMLKD